MIKTQAMEVARAAKPQAGKWAKESDVRMECFVRDLKMPRLDGADLRSLKALADAIYSANKAAT